MLKNILIGIIVILSLVCCFLVYSKHSKKIEISHLIEKVEDLQETQPNVYKSLIEEINVKNEHIKSFYSKDFNLLLWENGHRIRLTGTLAYEKPKNFRFRIRSILGDELDIGSNSEKFWYWSRRDKKPGVYWAAYEDFNKTRLKTPFDPMLMTASLGFETIDLEKAIVTDSATDVMLTFHRENSMGEPILYSVFVNKTRKQIDGFLITNLQGKTLVSCEILNHSLDLPERVNYNWYEENRQMTIVFTNPVHNKSISSSSFVMPTYDAPINMAEE